MALSMTVIILFTGILMVWLYSPNIKNEITNLNHHYMDDISLAYGHMLDEEILLSDVESIVNYDYLGFEFGVKCPKTSDYAFILELIIQEILKNM